MSDKSRKDIHMTNSDVLNLELSNYSSLGHSQDAAMAMPNRAWLQEPNYSPTQRGNPPGSLVFITMLVLCLNSHVYTRSYVLQ